MSTIRTSVPKSSMRHVHVMAKAGIPLGNQSVLLKGVKRQRGDNEESYTQVVNDEGASLLPLSV